MIVSHFKAITKITHVSNSLQNLVQPLISCQEVIQNKFHADLKNPLRGFRDSELRKKHGKSLDTACWQWYSLHE